MSLERLKKLTLRITTLAKVLHVITVIMLICELVSFLWLSIMPNKLSGFFHIVRVWAPFISNVEDVQLSLFELAGTLVNHVFLFLILGTTEKAFRHLSVHMNILDTIKDLKKIAFLFLGDAIILPLVKSVSYSVFLGEHIPHGIFDDCSIIVSAIIYFLSVFIESRSVEVSEEKKEEEKV